MKSIRKIRTEGEIAFVPLGGKGGYEAMIDASDVHLVEGCNWNADVQRRADGTVRAVYARRTYWLDGKSRTLLMHRAIAEACGVAEVDHKDGNGLNNRRANLRPATTAQNQHNSRMRPNNTSGVKGVSWHKRNEKWQAQVTIQRRRVGLGYFGTIEEAAAAIAQERAKLHGEFACAG